MCEEAEKGFHHNLSGCNLLDQCHACELVGGDGPVFADSDEGNYPALRASGMADWCVSFSHVRTLGNLRMWANELFRFHK